MIQLKNKGLEVFIKSAGAELTRIYSRQHNIDYLWNADPQFWEKHAPVLFPIVGTLKENTYYFHNQAYHLSRHGFARDKKFKLIQHDEQSAVFELQHSDETLLHYPFKFTLRIHYSLKENELINRYEVVNNDTQEMYFSIGGHPAFNVPLEKGEKYHNYYFELEQPETAYRWRLENHLIDPQPVSFLENQRTIALSHELFSNDAIILKNLRSKSISLKSNLSSHGITMRIEDFPYLGIWAAEHAPFVCIEPWQGLSDSLYHNQRLKEKEGIVNLAAQQSWTKSWALIFW